MSGAGISIASDLAIVVATNGVPLQTLIYTPDDGRAFRGCPYFKHWISTGQIYTHDADLPIDLSRVLKDVCRMHGCASVGFDPKQAPMRATGTIDLRPVDSHDALLPDAMRFLNSAAKGFDGFLYPENSPMQYMWASLPELNGERFLPTADEPATGRIDGVWALLYALIASGDAGAVASERGNLSAEAKRIAALDGLRAYRWIWIRHRFHGVIKVRPDQLRIRSWLESGEAQFIKPAEDWELTCPMQA